MIRRDSITSAVVLIMGAVALVGCNSNEVTQPSSAETQQQIQAAAPALGVAAPSAAAADLMIRAMMTRIDVGSSLRGLGETLQARSTNGTAPAFAVASCPVTFALGDGILGNCSATPSGVVTFTFAGTKSIDGASVQIEGSLVAQASSSQPESGTSWDVTLSASASAAFGSATWSASGHVVLDDAHQVFDYSFAMSYSIALSGGGSVAVSATLTPSAFDLSITGTHGRTLTLALDRASLAGTASLDGALVAHVAIENGCVTIDYVNPELADETRCPAE